MPLLFEKKKIKICNKWQFVGSKTEIILRVLKMQVNIIVV
jgi:hypothetical protein